MNSELMATCWRKTGNKMANAGDISLNEGIILQIHHAYAPAHSRLGLCALRRQAMNAKLAEYMVIVKLRPPDQDW